MHPQELINTILSRMWEWSIRNSAVTKIAHNDHEIRFTTADGSEHTCHFTDDHPKTIQDIRPPEAAFLGAPTRPEKIWVYEDCSKPREKVSIVLINKQAAEKNDRTMAEYRTRRDQRAQAAREAREAARKERQATYQRDHVAPLNKILEGKTVERIAFTDDGFSITVGGLVVQVTPDVRVVSISEFGDEHAVGLRVDFGGEFVLSTHELEAE